MATAIRTVADLLRRLGDVPADRIRFHPPLGTATVADVVSIRENEGVLCELIEGVLLEKTVGMKESRLAMWLGGMLNLFIIPKNLGFVAGPDGGMELLLGLVRIPDVAFISWDRTPDRTMPTAPVPQLAPNLAVEVLSKGNTVGEMAAKRIDYFAARVELVWEIHPAKRTVAVYTSPTDCTMLGAGDTLDGGTVLPGYTLTLAELFGELDRKG